MKVAAIALTALGLAVAGSAAAASRPTDVDYLKANRCKGLATGMGSDTSGFDAYLKVAGRTRVEYIVERGQEEFTKAKRQATESDMKDRLNAELSGPCMAFSGAPGQTVAGGGSNPGASTR